MARIKACAYCRVSTKDMEQVSSLENQKAYFQREFSKNGRYDNYEFVGLYVDQGRSGTSLKRPDFDRMIADAGVDKSQIDGDLFHIVGKPKFNRIFVKNSSRFARNVSSDMLLKTLAKNSVYVEFVDTTFSTDNPATIMALQMLQVIDESASRDKSSKVLFGIQEGIKRGNIHSHGNFYGYKYHPKPDNYLEIIEKEAEVVRLIFDLYANKNMGVHRIRQHLIDNGIFARSGKPFSERGLRVMIQNEHYSGRAVRHKFTNGLIFDKHPTKETGEAIIFDTDKVPAIVDIETFEKAQRVLESKVQHTTQKGIYRGKTDYAGKIICGCCGAPYYASSSDIIKSAGGRVRSYACKTKRTMHKDENGNRVMLCTNRNVSERELDSFLSSSTYTRNLWFRLRDGIKELEGIKEALENRINRQRVEEVSALQEQLAEIQRQKEKLLDLFMSDMFSKAQLEERVAPLKAEEEALTATIKKLSRTNEEIQADIAEVVETLDYLKAQREAIRLELKEGTVATKLSREEILADLECVIVQPDGKLQFKLKGIEGISAMVAKHRYLIEKPWTRRRLA